MCHCCQSVTVRHVTICLWMPHRSLSNHQSLEPCITDRSTNILRRTNRSRPHGDFSGQACLCASLTDIDPAHISTHYFELSIVDYHPWRCLLSSSVLFIIILCVVYYHPRHVYYHPRRCLLSSYGLFTIILVVVYYHPRRCLVIFFLLAWREPLGTIHHYFDNKPMGLRRAGV